MFSFSENLKHIMNMRGINQKWLSIESNTPEATISRYVNGVHKPNIDIIVDIAKALNVSVDYLLGLTPFSDILQKTDPELNFLISCYNKASERDRKILWRLLEDYLSPEEKDGISYFSDKKK